MRTTVIIPTYNESQNLPKIVSALFALPLEIKILVVDDASPDGTGKIADELGNANPGRLSVIHRTGKLGLSSAYLQAFQSLFQTDTELIVQMDADFSHDPYRPGRDDPHDFLLRHGIGIQVHSRRKYGYQLAQMAEGSVCFWKLLCAHNSGDTHPGCHRGFSDVEKGNPPGNASGARPLNRLHFHG